MYEHSHQCSLMSKFMFLILCFGFGIIYTEQIHFDIPKDENLMPKVQHLYVNLSQ